MTALPYCRAIFCRLTAIIFAVSQSRHAANRVVCKNDATFTSFLENKLSRRFRSNVNVGVYEIMLRNIR
jgi:hypothetical protein